MDILVGSALGAVLGLGLSLVPGLHAALGIALMLGVLIKALGGLGAACCVAAAVGVGFYVRHLGAVYHPSAGAVNVASLDPAMRLTNLGRGADVLRLMVLGTDMSWVPVGILASILCLGLLAGVNLANVAKSMLSLIGPLAIGWWVFYTCSRSAKPALTAIGFLIVGAYGYVVLHHPGLAGNEHQLAPLMSGLYALPIMLATLAARSKGLPPQKAPKKRLILKRHLGTTGAWLGCATGFLPGMGSSSVVGLAGSQAKSDEDYILLASAGQSSNDSLALLLMLAAGMGRSGESVLLGRAMPQPNFMACVTVVLVFLISVAYGRKLVFQLESIYARFIKSQPPVVWGALVIGLAILQVLMTGQILIGLGLTACGCMIALWCRVNHLPLQVSFSALACPLVIQSMGLVPLVNGMVF